MPGADPAAGDRLLLAATDRRGRGPMPWATAPLRDAARVLILTGGAGPLVATATPDGDRLRVDAAALPLRPRSVDGVAVLLALPHLPDLDAAFGELRRVLRPAGTLVVVVPSGSVRTAGELRFAPVLAAARRTGRAHRSALDHAGWLLAAADFSVLSDDRVSFTLPLHDPAAARALAADLTASGLWPAGVDDDASVRLADRAGPGRRLPVPLRRIVARR